MMVILNVEVYLDGSDAEANLDILMITGCGMLAVSKMASFRIYSAKLIFSFASAAKDYDQLNDEQKRTIMRRHAYMARVVCVGLVIPSNFCALMFTILPMLTAKPTKVNVTVENGIAYPMPSERVMALLEMPKSLYLPICFMESLMLLITAVGNLGSDSFFLGIVLHVCGQIEILKLEFNRIANENGRTVERFYSSIERHRHLLDLVEKLNDTISTGLMIQLFISCMLICTCGFQFILALNDGNVVIVVKSFFILGTVMVQMFAYSYVGNYLKCQIDDVGYSLYSCEWYNVTEQVGKDIIFVIMKAQKPVQLTAGKFFVINLETYMSILRTSASYLSVLRVMLNA